RNGSCFEKASGRRIRALLAVHVLGYACDLNRLQEILRAKGVLLIEDAAEALGSTFQEKKAGNFGLLACLSFNGNKILTTGGGGMVLTNDPHLADQVRHLSTQAKSFSAEYIHDQIGYNYRMPNLNAALGLGQIERLPEFLARKRDIQARYAQVFAEVADLHTIAWKAGDQPNHWLVTLFHPKARQLEEFLTIFGIQARKLWVPMNRLPMYRDCIYIQKNDQSHHLYEHSLSLPSSSGLSDQDLEFVLEKLNEFFSRG
ncbi:MAG TPA: aminotransferase DegT, partial [Bacteroidetes bacterium]|nr:aminotransferase DegT [Bacteroidota bacterium]